MRKCFLVHLALVILLSGCAHTTPSVSHEGSHNATYDPAVLVTQNCTEILVKILMKGTGLRVVRAIPQGYPMRGHASYFRKHWKTVQELASHADVAVSLRSAWSADPIYAWARRANIRIVHVDATRPLTEQRAGVPLLQQQDKTISPFVWRSPANMARMADIAGADLMEIFPEYAEGIRRNLRVCKRALFQMRSRFEEDFSMLERFELVTLTQAYDYLLDEFGLTVVKTMTTPEHKWTEKDSETLQRVLRNGDVRSVLCAWAPKQEILKVIHDSGAKAVVLSPLAIREGDPLAQLLVWYEGNLNALYSALQ